MSRQQLPYILAGVVLMTLQPILVTLSQDAQGHLEYSPISSTLLSELAKLSISLAMLAASGSGARASVSRELLEYAVPAFIYFVNNNLVFVILSHVDATNFQLLSQLKTVFTGLLFRAFLGRHLTAFQYLAILQLAAGTATSQLAPCSAVAGGARSSMLGVLLSIVSCVLSAFGGIYSEKLLKDRPADSIHWQNVQLYVWGIVFNVLAALLHSGRSALGERFFVGFRGWAWAVVLNNACNGLAISAILKYADNIARVYAHACAMLVTMMLSVVLFGTSPSAQLLIAITMVSASAVQYNLKSASTVGSPGGGAYAALPSSAAAER